MPEVRRGGMVFRWVSGFAWWGCGKPGWWNDVGASGGGHFSITPTNNYASDTVNMTMIEGAFQE